MLEQKRKRVLLLAHAELARLNDREDQNLRRAVIARNRSVAVCLLKRRQRHLRLVVDVVRVRGRVGPEERVADRVRVLGGADGGGAGEELEGEGGDGLQEVEAVLGDVWLAGEVDVAVLAVGEVGGVEVGA